MYIHEAFAAQSLQRTRGIEGAERAWQGNEAGLSELEVSIERRSSKGVQRKSFKGSFGFVEEFLGLDGRVINSD